MGDEIRVPRDLVEQVAAWAFPASTDSRLQSLMDRNNDGILTPVERQELESLVAVSESMSLLRARALKALGRRP